MTSFPFPTLLDCPSGEKYRVLRRFGRSVFLALNITYGDVGEDPRAWKDGKGTGMVAVKFEPKHVERHRLHDRSHAYNSLAGGPGIPFLHGRGTTKHHRYIVLDLLGPSLEDLFGFCDRKFTLKTILLIADQALSRVEYIHSQSCAHGEIIPKNLVMGLGKFGNLLHLINPGSAKDPDADLDVAKSFCNDLSSLGYVLLHFAWPEFSWEELKSKSTEDLCRRLPEEFSTYFNYIDNLRSGEKPSCSYLREAFDDLFRRMCFNKDYVFDWTIIKYRRLAEKAKADAQPEPLALEEDSSDVKISNSKDDAAMDIEDELIGNESPVPGEVTPSTDIRPQNTYDIALQLESQPLSHDRLVAEVKGIYAGLFMLEKKCIEVHKNHSKPRQVDAGGHLKLPNHQCRALIDLYRVQLFEIHDIISASQHPAANPSLHKWASQRKVPTRMFRHSIQPLLDLLRDYLPESYSNFLSFLRLSYSVAALLYETAPKLKATWIECLYELARIFKEVDTESGAMWEERLRYWKSLRDPAVMGILQADLSDVMLPDAFPVSTEKRIESGKIFLQEKDVVPHYLSEKSLALSPHQFTKNSSDGSHSPVATCRDMFFVASAAFISSSYILRHEAQDWTWWGSELQAQSFDPIYSNSIPDFSPVLFLGSYIAFACSLASFHCRSRLDRYQTCVLILASLAGIITGYGSGIGANLIIFGVIPWALWFGMILSIVGHWGRRYWRRTRCARIELREDTVR